MDKNYFRTRRSVRSFADTPVDQAALRSMVEQAAKAPTTGNMQLYSVVATTDKEGRERVAGYHFNQPATKAPVLLTVCADYSRFERWCELSDAVAGFRNWQGFFYGVLDAIVFAQQLVTVAETMGYGTCYLGTTLFNATEIAAELRLPKGVVPLITIALGWPAELGEETERISADGVLHMERYSDFSNEDIMRIYAPKDEFAPNARYVAEHSKQNLAQVFTDVRYPKAMNEEFSIKLRDFLRAQGFDLG